MVQFTNGMVKIKRESELHPYASASTSIFSLEGLNGFRATCEGFDEVGIALRHCFIFKNEDLKIARLLLDSDSSAQVALNASPVS